MRVFFGAVAVLGVAVSVAALLIEVEPQDPAFTAVSWARSVGFTLAACAIFLWVVIAPALRRAGLLRQESPDAVVLVCQRSHGLVDGLLRRKNADSLEIGRIPWYFVLRATRGRLEIWSSRARLVSMSGADILEIRTGVALLARRQSCLTLAIRAESGAPSQIDLPVGRDRWELWPISDTAALRRLAEALRAEVGRSRVP